MYHRQLDLFLCVADYGSFTKAAEHMYISPTAVMKQMNLLESSIGVPLFFRSSKGISLTSAGKSVYNDTLKINKQFKQLILHAQEAASKGRHTLRIGNSFLFPYKNISSLCQKITQIYPKLNIQIIPFEQSSSNLLSLFTNLGQEIDIIVGPYGDSNVLSASHFIPLGRTEICVALSRSHPLSHKPSLSPSDLHNECIIRTKHENSLMNQQFKSFIKEHTSYVAFEYTDAYYDATTFNHCESDSKLLLSLDCWSDVHPNLKMLPLNPSVTIPFGLYYPLNPSEEILFFINAIKEQKMILKMPET